VSDRWRHCRPRAHVGHSWSHHDVGSVDCCTTEHCSFIGSTGKRRARFSVARDGRSEVCFTDHCCTFVRVSNARTDRAAVHHAVRWAPCRPSQLHDVCQQLSRHCCARRVSVDLQLVLNSPDRGADRGVDVLADVANQPAHGSYNPANGHTDSSADSHTDSGPHRATDSQPYNRTFRRADRGTYHQDSHHNPHGQANSRSNKSPHELSYDKGAHRVWVA
jgi:hypothetical protein